MPPYIAGKPFHPLGVPVLFPVPSDLSRAYNQGKTSQNRAKVKIYLPAFVFCRDFARPKGMKSKDIFEMQGEGVQDVRALAACFWLVTGAGGRGCPLLSWRVPSFCPLSCFALGVLLSDMPLFGVLRGFLAGFYGFVWVCIASVLCVDCVAFVRVRCLAVSGL